MRSEFIGAIKANQPTFGIDLSDDVSDHLADYYEIVLEHNAVLHLVGPCSPEEFAIRHILESLMLLEFLPTGARFADVGTGAGLPAIPCLIARDDLKAVLIESKEKKSGFLQTALAKCKLERRAEVVNRQFSEIERPDVSYVTCRALDKFTQKLPLLLKWSGNCGLVFFGGHSLRDALTQNHVPFAERLLPMSEQRFLFHIPRRKEK